METTAHLSSYRRLARAIVVIPSTVDQRLGSGLRNVACKFVLRQHPRSGAHARARLGNNDGKIEMTAFDVHLQRVDRVPLAVVRRRATAPEFARLIPECCGLVWNVVREQKTPAGRHVAVYWDDTIRLEVGVELQGAFDERNDVVRSATPAGTVATVTHLGPYAGLGGAHDAVRRWCDANGHHLAGPSWEVYGHWLPEWHSNPSLIRTDVYYVLAEN